MRGRDFLTLARERERGGTEPHWRGAMVDTYYALFLECRDALVRWGFPIPARHSVHATVRLRFSYANNADLKTIGDALDDLVQRRNRAHYDLSPMSWFADAREINRAIRLATDALALLNSTDSDPALRAVAIASIRP
jgi:hypothetical protein